MSSVIDKSGGWSLVNSINLPKDFYPRYPKENNLVFVVKRFVNEENKLLYSGNQTVRINVNKRESEIIEDLPMFYITYKIKPEEEKEQNINININILTVDIDFDYNYMNPNTMYWVRLDDYDQKRRGFIYRPDEQKIDHYIEIK